MKQKIFKLLCEIAKNEELLEKIAEEIEKYTGHELKDIFCDCNDITLEETENYLKEKYDMHKWTYEQIIDYLKSAGFDYAHYKTTPEEMYLLMNKMYYDHKEIHGEISADKAKLAAIVFLKHHNVEDLIFTD